jgi:3'(2'), 5'-bisphosphate nucleotidase
VGWAGAETIGAFEVSAAGVRKPIHVSEVADLAGARAVVSRSHQSDRLPGLIAALGIGQMIPRGSAGLKAADVAAGAADVYFQPGHAGKRWDTCAPEAILLAAGGIATDARGRPIEYGGPELGNKDGFLATNGKLHAPLLEALRRTGHVLG